MQNLLAALVGTLALTATSFSVDARPTNQIIVPKNVGELNQLCSSGTETRAYAACLVYVGATADQMYAQQCFLGMTAQVGYMPKVTGTSYGELIKTFRLAVSKAEPEKLDYAIENFIGTAWADVHGRYGQFDVCQENFELSAQIHGTDNPTDIDATNAVY